MKKSVKTFMLAMTIQTLLISIHSALTVASQTLLTGLHWKIIVMTMTAEYVDMKRPTAQSIRLNFLPGKMRAKSRRVLILTIPIVGA